MSEPTERVIFGNTVEGLFHKALKGKLSDRARNELKTVGVDLDKPLLPAYPLESWERALVIAVADVYPQLPQSEGFRALGKQVITGIRSTMLGKAVEQLLRVMGPRRTLARMNQNLRTSDNFVESKLTELAPTSVEIWISHTMGRPTYYVGIFEEMMDVVGAKSPQVEVRNASGVEATFRISWTA